MYYVFGYDSRGFFLYEMRGGLLVDFRMLIGEFRGFMMD